MVSQTGKQKGWITLYRKTEDSEIWTQEPWRFKAWIYLLLNANHKNDDQKKLQRGQLLIRSSREFAKALAHKKGRGWDSPTTEAVKTYWAWLRKKDMITTHKTTRGVIITILNYNEYQDDERDRTTNITTKIATHGQPMNNRGRPMIDNNIITKELNHQQSNVATLIKELENRYGIDIHTSLNGFRFEQVVDAVRIMEARMEDGETIKNKIGLIITLCKERAQWNGSKWQIREKQKDEEEKRKLNERNCSRSPKEQERAEILLEEMREKIQDKFPWKTSTHLPS